MTALSESTSVKNVGVVTERTFFHGHFLKELLRFSRLAYIVSTIDTGFFIISFLNFASNKRTYCTT